MESEHLEMEGLLAPASSSLPTGEGDRSGTSFPKSVNFWLLYCYYDRLGSKFKDPVLQGIGEDVKERVQHLKTKQERVEEWVDTLLGDMFGASLIENLEVTAATVEDVITLKLLLGSFKKIEESIENEIAQIARNSVMAGNASLSDVGHLILSPSPILDSGSIQVSLPEDAEDHGAACSSALEGSSDDEIRIQDQVSVTRWLTTTLRVSSSSGSDEERDDGSRPSTAGVVSNISEELREFLQEGSKEQESARHTESSTNVEGKSGTDVNDSGSGLKTHLGVPELEEKLQRTLNLGTASSESHRHSAVQEKVLQWMNDGLLSKEDHQLMSHVKHQVGILEDQLAPILVDLFLLLKRYNLEAIETLQFNAALERWSGEDDTKVVKMIAYMLLMADQELHKVGRIDFAKEDSESSEKERVLELVAEEISKLNRMLKETQRDFRKIVMELNENEVQKRLRQGKFAGMIIALAEAVSKCIQV
ncbi:hypothetical protein MLD38_016685 [Melastoma candidum]|uniref:Uncharacterized protein n=1 Tax=Melastoma candidum TaxID=119954 RepID=A0ACB9QN39_9MYRT|nr:hypothetical protein MLD38_016685 [Melastoma candidum]